MTEQYWSLTTRNRKTSLPLSSFCLLVSLSVQVILAVPRMDVSRQNQLGDGWSCMNDVPS